MTQTVGRDKALRLIQYFSRFYAWYLYRTNHPESAFKPYEITKKQLGLTRKILRVGKFVEHFKAAAQVADSRTLDPVLKFLAVSRQLGYAGYLTLDTITVLDATGVKKWDGAKRASTEAMRFWFFGIASSIAAGLYSLNRLRLRRQTVDKKEGEGVVESKKIERYGYLWRIQFHIFDHSVHLLTISLGNGTMLFFN